MIAFVRSLPAGDCGEQTDVFLMRPDGSNVRNLTNTSTVPVGCVIDESGPDWSHDGMRLAYFSNEGGKTNIYTVRFDGEGGAINLTGDYFQGSSDPSWSPDGSQIAFVFMDNAISGGDDTAGIAVMNSDGTGIVKIRSVPCVGGCSPPRGPDWSPDGTRIVFTNDDGDIYTMNPDGTDLVNLTNHLSRNATPAWSPDGSKIAFASNRGGRVRQSGRFIWEIHIMNADGSEVVSLTAALPSSWEPSWSPDGDKIAFMVYPENSRQDIWVMNSDGTGQENITNAPSRTEVQPSWRPR